MLDLPMPPLAHSPSSSCPGGPNHRKSEWEVQAHEPEPRPSLGLDLLQIQTGAVVVDVVVVGAIPTS